MTELVQQFPWILHLVSELQLHAVTPETATLSSTSSAALNCIDDDTATYCSSTQSADPWLSVQLPASATVSYVVLHHREDCCQSDLSPLETLSHLQTL